MDTLTCEEKNDYAIITFKSETISFFNVAPLKDKMEELLKKDTKKVLMDFRQVRFVDSAGVGGILVACLRLHRQEGKVFAIGVKERVHKILEHVDRDSVIQYYESEEEALAAIQA
jgi:anti-anti-sigma factor